MSEVRDGLLLVDKEAGGTSHDVVQWVRRALRQKKIGHCGTLDPDATGLLLLTLGRATRLTRFLIRAPKVYAGVIRFGTATDTYDASGKTTFEHAVEGLSLHAVHGAMAELVGTYEQAPPPYSAKKSQGVRHYELARRGEEVPETSKEVTIYDFSPQGELEDGTIRFTLSCTSGTYARTLAHETGRKLGCGGHLASLRRLKIGPFSVDDAVTVGELETRFAPEGTPGGCWIPFDDIPLPFPQVTADAQQENRIANGQTVLVREFEATEGDWIKLVNLRRQFIAVGTVVERIGDRGVGVVQPKVVFK